MIIHAITEILPDLVPQLAPGSSHTAVAAADGLGFGSVCPTPPPGVAPFADQIVSWIKWGVLGLIFAAGFISVGFMVAGKMASNGRAAQVGSAGLFWTVLGAVAYAVVYGILVGVVGKGC